MLYTENMSKANVSHEELSYQGNYSFFTRLKKYVPLKKSDTLQNVSMHNLHIVDELLTMSRKLHKAGKRTDANKLLDIAAQILATNKDIQQVVGELLSESD